MNSKCNNWVLQERYNCSLTPRARLALFTRRSFLIWLLPAPSALLRQRNAAMFFFVSQ